MMYHPSTRSSLIVAMIAILCAAVTSGCEKHVVRTTYSPITGIQNNNTVQTGTLQLNNPYNQPAKNDFIGNLFKGAGDLLFGWTKIFDDNSNKNTVKLQTRQGFWQNHQANTDSNTSNNGTRTLSPIHTARPAPSAPSP